MASRQSLGLFLEFKLCMAEFFLLNKYNVFVYKFALVYLDDILNINNIHFDNMVCHIYPSVLKLEKRIPLIPQLRFWTNICPFLIILFLPKSTINLTILILKF